MAPGKEGATAVVPSTPENKAKCELANQLIASGLTAAEVARTLGVKHSTVRSWTDPEYAQRQRQRQRERMLSYGRPCKICGKQTTGSNGRAKAPEYCAEHFHLSPQAARANEAKRKWTQERVIDAIKDWYVLYGDTPSGIDWNPTTARERGQHLRAQRWEDGNFPWFSQVFRLFGSWNAAIEAAGFEPRPSGGFSFNAQRRFDKHEEWTGEKYPHHKPRTRKRPQKLKEWKPPMSTKSDERKYWTAERILEKIHEWHALYGRPPTATEWLKRVPIVDGHRIWPSPSEMSREFGSWSRAIRAAGLKPRHEKQHLVTDKPVPVRKHWTREEVIECIQRWHAEHGIVPTQKDWVYMGDYPSAASVKRLFGSWTEAIRTAGYVPLSSGITRKAISKYLPIRKELA